MAKGKATNIGISVGASVESVAEARAGIMDILNSGAEQQTLRAALDNFATICNVNNSVITNCNIEIPTD